MLAAPRCVLTAVLLAACGGSGPSAADEPPDIESSAGVETEAPAPVVVPDAQVRLIHAAVEAHEQAIALAVDGSAESDPAGFEFASRYLPLSPGDHAVSARSGDTELIQASFTFGLGLTTLVAYSTRDFPVALAFAADRSDAPPANSAQLRIFHAIVGLGALDVCAPPPAPRGDGTPIVTNIALGALGGPGYVSVPAGADLPLQLRAHHATPCHGRGVGSAHFTPASESNYTLVLVGRSGRHGLPLELLFCADPPATDTSCATVAIEAS
jgi:hypothetical protein